MAAYKRIEDAPLLGGEPLVDPSLESHEGLKKPVKGWPRH
jgi:hypothetical protein